MRYGSSHRPNRAFWFFAFILLSRFAVAHEDHAGSIEEIVVYGRAEEQLGVATAASSGQVGDADIQLFPKLRVGELVESVPGMVATQHSGTGKANQYYLRGFNLDHGTDFSAHAQGVPVNLRTHGHGQGYLDLNFLIPEMVATTKFRKGPYHAAVGDFSSAGSVEFFFYDRLAEPVVSVTMGEDNYLRGLVAASAELGPGVLTGAFDVTRYDGPWQQPENLEQDKLQLRYAVPLGNAELLVDFQGYQARWDATDQIPSRAVHSGLIDELGFIDPDLGGATDRYAIAAAVEFDEWAITAYAVDYDFTLYSNFTYFLEFPSAGDEFEQRDRRRMYGLNLEGAHETEVRDRNATVRWGVQTRIDDIDQLGLYRTQARERRSAVRADSVAERSVGAYGEVEVQATDRLRTILGVRGDYYEWNVRTLLTENEGSNKDAIYSPKLSIAYRLSSAVEAYANWGRGFHSNDVRGTTISKDPVTAEPVDPVAALVGTQGAEIGVRVEQGKRFNAALVGFWLELDSELVFVGDAGGTEANAGSKRSGVEAAVFWHATNWLALDGNYTFTDAAYVERQDGGKRIPGSVESTGSLGLSAVLPMGATVSARVRYLGPAPLVEDGSVWADESILVNAGVGYRLDSLELRLDVFNVFNSNDHDISYFYASRLPGEPVEGVEDVHFHPLEPRTVRASLVWRPGKRR